MVSTVRLLASRNLFTFRWPLAASFCFAFLSHAACDTVMLPDAHSPKLVRLVFGSMKYVMLPMRQQPCLGAGQPYHAVHEGWLAGSLCA